MARSKLTYERIASAIEEYIDEMKGKGLAPSMAGLAVKLETYKQRLSAIMLDEPDETWSDQRIERQRRKSDLLKRFKNYSESVLHEHSQGNGKCTGAIFLLKAAHAYRDRDAKDDSAANVTVVFNSGVTRPEAER